MAGYGKSKPDSFGVVVSVDSGRIHGALSSDLKFHVAHNRCWYVDALEPRMHSVLGFVVFDSLVEGF